MRSSSVRADRLPINPDAVQQRREAYYAARREGMGIVDAGVRAGLDEWTTMKRYERWFQAVEAGLLVTREKKIKVVVEFACCEHCGHLEQGRSPGHEWPCRVKGCMDDR
jgi:hypothetical protein